METRRPSVGRISSLDALKVIAIFAVIIIHVPASAATASFAWQALVQTCRFAVPAFFLVSGYLFFLSWERIEDPAALFFRTTVRLALIFVAWAMFYAVVPPFITGAPQGISEAIQEHFCQILRHPRHFVLAGTAYHLWFLSSLLQALTILWVCLRYLNLTVALLVGFTFYALALALGPYSSLFSDHRLINDPKNGPLLSTCFVALGAFLAKRRWRPPFAFAAGLTSLGLALIFFEANVFQGETSTQWSNQEFSLGTIPYALGIFLLALSQPSRGATLGRLGIYSLGIYAIHPYVIECLGGLLAGLNPGIFAVVTFATSTLIAVGLARLPFARRVVS